MSTSLPLKNKTVLITRPQHLADSLLKRITDAGGIANHYPVIRISDIEDSEALNSILNNLSSFDIAIFISPTAVHKALEKIHTLPDKLILAVIGSSTEVALNKYGYQAQIIPDDFNSESLLQHTAFQSENIENKSIVIFRGVGGRELLGDQLIQRGAKLTYAEIYRREKNSLAPLTSGQLADIDVLTVSSNEALQNLIDLTDIEAKPILLNIPIIVPSSRAHNLAVQFGFTTIIQARNATDDAFIQALTDGFST